MSAVLAAGPAAGLPAHAGRIGPNAITRVAEVLPGFVGSRTAWDVFEQAGLLDYLRAPPQQMVDEAEVRALHHTLRHRLGVPLAAQVAHLAGERTALYLLAHRIPKPVQTLLHGLPAALAARVLMKAISRHAWTFAGSGCFEVRWHPRHGVALALRITRNPLCRDLHSETPACGYYAAVFATLLRTLVSRRALVREVACEACGDSACVFEVSW